MAGHMRPVLICLAALLPLMRADSQPAGLFEHSSTCLPHEFQCGHGECIPRAWLCDYDYDCPDQTDEADCDEHAADSIECDAAAEFDCASAVRVHSMRCIPNKWKCDGEKDCTDGSDERIDVCKDHQCADDQFLCKSKAAVGWHAFPGAFGGAGNFTGFAKLADEAGGTIGVHLPPARTEPASVCVPVTWRCDGQTDCLDGADEAECPKFVTKNTTTGAVLRLYERTCNTYEFRCADRSQCIYARWRCDGEPDCDDASDEAGCTPEEIGCGPDTHKCLNSTLCVPDRWRCDGQDDCVHGDDEAGCREAELFEKQPVLGNLSCATWEFACRRHNVILNCILSHWRCDGETDCFDGSDEAGCESTHAVPTLPATTPEPPCDERTHTWDTAQKCIFKNPCDEPGRCSHRCTLDTDGTPECTCFKGYLLQADGRSCKAMGNDPRLLLSNRVTIRQVDLRTRASEPLVQNLSSAIAVDYLYHDNTVIWSDVAQRKIYKCELGAHDASDARDLLRSQNVTADGCEVPLVAKDIETPDGLAVDWIHYNVYWTDAGYDTISVMGMRNAEKSGLRDQRKTLFDDELQEPRAIVLDPDEGYLFWSDWGEEVGPRIERAELNGANRVKIIEDRIKWPNGLALDLLARRMYWADAKLDAIWSNDYDGNDRRLVLMDHAKLRHPFSLTVFEDVLYYADWDVEVVSAVNKFTGRQVQQVIHAAYGLMGMRVYHESMQPRTANKCLRHACEHLCLPRRVTLFADVFRQHECHCHDGYVPAENRSPRCVPKVEGQGAGVDGDGAGGAAELMKKVAAVKDESSGDAPAGHVQSGRIFVRTFFVLLIVSLVVGSVGYVYYRRWLSTHGRPYEFENPVYRNTVTLEADPDAERRGDLPRDVYFDGAASAPTVGYRPPGAERVAASALDDERTGGRWPDAAGEESRPIAASVHFDDDGYEQPLTGQTGKF